MVSRVVCFAVAMVLVLGLLAISGVVADSSYRKPPFNGSIFGKRSNTGNAIGNNNGTRDIYSNSLYVPHIGTF